MPITFGHSDTNVLLMVTTKKSKKNFFSDAVSPKTNSTLQVLKTISNLINNSTLPQPTSITPPTIYSPMNNYFQPYTHVIYHQTIISHLLLHTIYFRYLLSAGFQRVFTFWIIIHSSKKTYLALQTQIPIRLCSLSKPINHSPNHHPNYHSNGTIT